MLSPKQKITDMRKAVSFCEQIPPLHSQLSNRLQVPTNFINFYLSIDIC